MLYTGSTKRNHSIKSLVWVLALLLNFFVSNGVCANVSPGSSLSSVSSKVEADDTKRHSSVESTSSWTELPTLDPTTSIPSGEDIPPPPEPKIPSIVLPLPVLPPAVEEKVEKQTKSRPGDGSLVATSKQDNATAPLAGTNPYPFVAGVKDNILKFGSLVLDLLKTQLTNTLNSGAPVRSRPNPGKKSTADGESPESVIRQDRKIGRVEEEKVDESVIDWLGVVMNGANGLGTFLRDLQVESLYEVVFLFFKWISLYYVGFLIP